MKHAKLLKKFLVVFLAANLIFGGFFFPRYALAEADQEDLQGDINKIQKKLEQATQRKQSLEQNLNKIRSSLNTTLSAINKTQSLLRETTDVLKRKELEIQLLEENVELKKETLSALMQEMYDANNTSLVAVMLGESDFSQALDESSAIASFEEKIYDLLTDIQDLQDKTKKEKGNLEEIKQENEELLAEKAAEKQALAADQAETQSDIKEQEATIAELQKKLQKLKSDLSSLLGTNISTNDVMEAAAIASKATGVRKAFILGELTQESGLGRFTGGCTYKNARMHSYDIPVFKALMKELDYDLNAKKVSCPGRGGGYGGAMGIAQFIPSTWAGYKTRIANMTGHNPPNPWSVTDGVVGMAIKLAAAGATSKGGEYAASMIYYCGTSHPKETYKGRVAQCNAYAKNVQRLAAGYEKNN